MKGISSFIWIKVEFCFYKILQKTFLVIVLIVQVPVVMMFQSEDHQVLPVVTLGWFGSEMSNIRNTRFLII